MNNILEIFNHISLTHDYAGLYFKKYADYLNIMDMKDKTAATEAYESSGNFHYLGAEFYEEYSAINKQAGLQKAAEGYNNAAESYIKQVEILKFLKNTSHDSSHNEEKLVQPYNEEKLIQVYNNIAKSYEKKAKSLENLDETVAGADAYYNQGNAYSDAVEIYKNQTKSISNSTNMEKLEEEYKKIIAVYCKAAQLYDTKEENLMHLESYEKVNVYNKIGEIYCNIATYHVELANLLLHLDRREEAGEMYEHTVETCYKIKLTFDKRVRYLAENLEDDSDDEEKRSNMQQELNNLLSNIELFYKAQTKLFTKKNIPYKSSEYLEISEINEKLTKVFAEKKNQASIKQFIKLINTEQLEIQKKELSKIQKKELLEIYIQQAIKLKNIENIKKFYEEPYKLSPEATNNRINNIKLLYPTTLPISSFGTIMTLLKQPKSTLDSITNAEDNRE